MMEFEFIQMMECEIWKEDGVIRAERKDNEKNILR
jgi:hypothetical protein